MKLKAQVDQEKQRFNEIETKLLTEKKRLEELYGVSSLERQEKMKQVSPDLQHTYERIITKYPGSAVVLIKNHVCQGCFMSLPPNTMNEVRQSVKPIRCESCSRILYYDEEKSETLN
jgi:predicted  nucleic acid-binding Zn-ribbon protein